MFFFDDENNNSFQEIRHIDESGNEFWYARELQEVLEYTEWRNFSKVIDKARVSCKTSGEVETSHFVDVNKMVESGVADIPVRDIKLSRRSQKGINRPCTNLFRSADPQAGTAGPV